MYEVVAHHTRSLVQVTGYSMKSRRKSQRVLEAKGRLGGRSRTTERQQGPNQPEGRFHLSRAILSATLLAKVGHNM